MYRIILLFTILVLPTQFAMASSLEVAGWIPWWQDEEGIESADDNIRELDIIYPFAFEVDEDGKLVDKAGLDDREWRSLRRLAERRRVDFMPTVMWFDGEVIHRTLSDEDLRADHIDEIVEMVTDGDYDGVNIDYEGKKADTIDYFSDFLRELEDELGRLDLSCTIEARTPAESLYREGEVPEDIRYANDYKEMAKHCDWVEIMAYDQQRADLKMNNERKGEPYNPVADVDWVEKVIELALEDIPEEKIMLGVPTYGRQWKLTVAAEWYKSYERIGAINLPDAEELAEENEVEPGRNKAGEVSYTYFPDDSPFKILEVLPVPEGTREGFEAAAQALLFATLADMEVPVNLVWYSDAGAIEDKIQLAKKYNLKGVAIFKIDGEEDKDIWDLF